MYFELKRGKLTRKDIYYLSAVAALAFGVAIMAFFDVRSLSPSAIAGTASTSTPAAASSTSAVPSVPVRSSAAPSSGAHTVASSAAVEIRRLSAASRFYGLLKSTGVITAIDGPGPYTIFVPTNTSFSLLPAGMISSLSESELVRLVSYHIVVGRAVNVAALPVGTIEALSRDMLNFSFGPAHNPMVNSAVVVASYKVSNGMVYLIDNVLVPPTQAY